MASITLTSGDQEITLNSDHSGVTIAAANGKSAYQSYLDSTADDPVLSEAEWIESLGGGGGGTWGSIAGTLSDQTDLQAALDGKAAALGADDNYVTDAEKTVIGNTSGTNTGDQNIQNVYDNSSSPEILTDATRLGLTIRRGSGADTDVILEGQNGAGSTTFSVTGDGVITGTLADAELAAIAGLTSAADKGIQFTGAGTAATFDLTTAGKALLDDATAADQRATLSIGAYTQSDTAPISPINGDKWFDTTTGTEYVRYDAQWISDAPGIASPDTDPNVAYVRTDGNDGTGTGKPGAPYLTIQAAITAGFSAFRIGVGTFATNLTLSGSSYSFIGQGIDETIISGTMTFLANATVTFEGVQNAGDITAQSAGVGKNLTIHGLYAPTATVSTNGTNGSAGANGGLEQPGTDGQPGTNAGHITAYDSTIDSITAIGGHGGTGGNGGDSDNTDNGGRGGDGGLGGGGGIIILERCKIVASISANGGDSTGGNGGAGESEFAAGAGGDSFAGAGTSGTFRHCIVGGGVYYNGGVGTGGVGGADGGSGAGDDGVSANGIGGTVDVFNSTVSDIYCASDPGYGIINVYSSTTGALGLLGNEVITVYNSYGTSVSAYDLLCYCSVFLTSASGANTQYIQGSVIAGVFT